VDLRGDQKADLPQESGCVSHQLPRLHDNSENSAQNLASANSEKLGKQSRHVSAEGDRVGTEIGREHAEEERQRNEEDTGTCACAEMVV
jgi:hypothetical protein